MASSVRRATLRAPGLVGLRVDSLCGSTRRRLCSATGLVAGAVVGSERNQRDFYQRNDLYDQISGPDNIHMGYYPHLDDRKKLVELDNVQAAKALTQRMVQVGGIDHTSRLIDLGCGRGLSACTIAQRTGAHCVGVDLTPKHIARAKELAAELGVAELTRFFEGSFTLVPEEAAALGPFTHVFSQAAFCHVHAELPAILEQVKRLLAPGGRVVVNDFLGASAPPSSDEERASAAAVFRRLHFEVLHGHREWRRLVEEAGFTLLRYEHWDHHMARSYEDRRDRARALGATMADGASLADNFDCTVRAIRARQIGMNCAVLAAD